MSRKFSHITYLLIIICLVSSCSLSARLKKADKAYAIGEYYAAGDMYRQLYTKIPSKDKQLRSEVAFKQGECYRIINNKRALGAYKNAIRNQYADSIVYLHYADVLRYQGQYADAAKLYTTYLEGHPNDYVASAGLYACQKVSEWKKQFTRYKIAPVKEFNAKRCSNFSPAYIGIDADAVTFTSNRSTQSKSQKKKIRTSPVTGVPTCNLFTSRKDAAGKWQEIELCEGIYESSESEGGESAEGEATERKAGQAEMGVCCFSADGKTMYFTFSQPVNGKDIGARIYCSNRASGEWGEAQEVLLFQDSSISVGHPSLNASGDTLFFVSDAPGGYGGNDIWFAVQDGSQWTDVQNMGPQINTSSDELFPYMHPSGRLYFASKGHPGYGGLDLFYADRQDSTWSIVNMGTPFNTNFDDFGITFAGDGQNGLFSSNRGQKKGYDLIYSFDLPKLDILVEGRILDMQGQNLSEGTIRLVGDDGTNAKAQIRRDGSYRLQLEKDTRYVMLATSRGYLNQSHQFNTMGLQDSYIYTHDFTLTTISKPVKMNNIFFEFGKWELTANSREGLDELVKMLKDNPNITIELSAHTDLVGRDESNKTLSLKRAQSVVNYLIGHDIESDRLTPVGYGEEKPVVVDAALNKQYPYLPIDQVLDETFILTLTAEQQAVCNALNRRTEFRVLKTTYNLY